MIVAGIGAQSTATAQDIVEAVTDCCQRAGMALTELGVLAGRNRAKTVTDLVAAASELHNKRLAQHKNATIPNKLPVNPGVGILVFSVAQLQQEVGRCVTHSERSMAATGVPCVAEAAALAAAGPDGMLLLPRVAFARVTCALAIAPGGTAT